ncbi:MAG: hypothetical protein WA705_31915 [Candidatus Ozemobacteraceae bacterium]
MFMQLKRGLQIAGMFLFLGFAPVFAGDLPWPFRVPFLISARFSDFQNYSGVPYFHGGTDLAVPAGTELYTPISGTVDIFTYRIDAGKSPLKFAYLRHPFRERSENSDGSPVSSSASPKGSYASRYVEVAITDSLGRRWMFRHVDGQTIPRRVTELDGTGKILPAGEKIGAIIPWSEAVYPETRRYDHLHFEITDAEGWYLNPERLMTTVSDTQPPEIKGIWFVHNEGDTVFSSSTEKRFPAPIVFGDIDIIARIDETMNGSRYFSTPWSVSAAISRVTATTTELLGSPVEVFRFDRLPMKGDRTQFATTVYKERLRVDGIELGSQGNSQMRVFYFILTNGDPISGYDPARSIHTSALPDGRYLVRVSATDFTGNTASASQEFVIQNTR